ncbi:MAG: CPBP family intramembrane glutamic endopeptidase, partial [Chloroflexota bacterium]
IKPWRMHMNDHLPGYKAKGLELRNLVWFSVIAFAWSWLWWYLFISGTLEMPVGIGTPDVDLATAGPIMLLILFMPYGPTLAAFLLTAFTEGRQGVKKLWKRFWNLKLNVKWLVVILFFFPLIRLLANLIGRLYGGDTPLLYYPNEPWLAIPPFIASIINGGLSEEFGWRGYALPRLQSKWNALTAAIILGAIEGVWHYPLLFMEGQNRHEESIPGLMVWFAISSVFRTWIFNNTKGSVLAAVLFHAMGNTAPYITGCCQSIWHLYLVYILAAVVIALVFGAKSLVRERLHRGPGGEDALAPDRNSKGVH